MDNTEEKFDDETLAAITYLANEEDGEIVIDVALSDYDEKSTKALCSILRLLSNEASILETISIIKDSLIAAGQQEMLIQILAEVGAIATDKAYKKKNDQNNDDKPCISPSDML